MSDELYEALERFSIMSLQSDIGDEKALEYIENITEKRLLKSLRGLCNERTRRMFNNTCSYCN